MYGAFGRNSSQRTPTSATPAYRASALEAVVEDEGEQERDPGEDQVPDEEPVPVRARVPLARGQERRTQKPDASTSAKIVATRRLLRGRMATW